MFITLGMLLLLVVLLAAVIYLGWRLSKCKCALYEKFENKEAEVETKEPEEKVVESGADGKAGAEADGKAEAEADGDMESAPKAEKKDAKDTNTKDGNGKKATDDAKDAKKSIADKFMSYGEMKIFEGLRNNDFSLQDVKRMIREGEITEKMIEKFLNRVESMENKESFGKKTAESVLEGFSGNGYASAVFY